MKIEDKNVLIIGSSGGIGRETALLFAQKRARIIVTYCKNKKAGKDIFSDCSRYTQCRLIHIDISNEKSIKLAVKKAVKYFGKIDILINAAGIMYKKSFIKHSAEEIQEQMNINLIGPMNVIKYTIPYLNKKGAIIINVVSAAGKRATHANHAAYSASKFGLRGFGQAIVLELPKNIKIYSVNPPPTATKMTNYKGISPVRVAEVILKTAQDKFHKRSGADIDIKKYIKTE